MSFWKNLAKVGMIAGGGLATAFTGGAASPLLMAAIGAGTGAGIGALDNGWKGALTGGALGAATGGLGGGAAGSVAKEGLKMSAGSTAKSLLTNPNVLSTIGSTIAAGTQQSAQNRGAMTEANLYRDQIAMQAQQQQEQALIQRAKLEMDQKAADAKARDDAAKSAIRGSAIQNWQPTARPDGVANVSFAQKPTGGGMEAAKEMERQALIRQLKGEEYTPLPAMPGPYNVSQVQQPGVMEKIGNYAAPILSAYGAIRKQQQQPPQPVMYGNVTPTFPHA